MCSSADMTDPGTLVHMVIKHHPKALLQEVAGRTISDLHRAALIAQQSLVAKLT